MNQVYIVIVVIGVALALFSGPLVCLRAGLVCCSSKKIAPPRIFSLSV